MSLRENDHHVISTTNGQVFLVPVEYDGDRRDPDDAIEVVEREHADNQPEYIYYEGLLSDSVQNAERDGISLVRD